MGFAIWLHLSTLPHKPFGHRPDGESSMFSKVFPPVSWDKRIGICSSASVLPVGVHDPIMKCHTICCSMVISYLFLHFLFLPCLFFTFTFLSPPSLLPIYQHSYPYFTVSTSKFSISDAITYANATLHGTNGLVS